MSAKCYASLSPRICAAVLASFPAAALADDALTLNPSSTYQTIDGWVGVLGAQVSPFQTTEMINRAVNQLGLTSFRMDQPFSGNDPGTTSWQSTINGINPSNANWATLDQLPGISTAAADSLMTNWVLPLQAAVEAEGEPFTLTTNPSWYNGGSTGILPAWMQYDPGAYAEVLVSFDEYLRDKYGVTPTFSTVINEAGNNNNMTPALEAQVIEAMGPMLKAAGLSTRIDLGSGVGPNVAEQYATSPSMTSQVWQYVGAIAYHNYQGNSADKVALAATAASHGVVTMENESDLATYNTMYDDLTNADVSYWGNYGIGGYAAGAGIQYLNTGVDGASFTVPSQYWNYRQVMYYVRPGAVRIGATDTNSAIQPMAFTQTAGPFPGTTVVMGNVASNATAQTEDLSGLAPGGKYGISYAMGLTSGQMLTEMGIHTASPSGAMTVAVPANAVLTVYPYSGNDAPEIYNDAASPSYLLKGTGGTSTALTVSATSPELSSLNYDWTLASEPSGAAASISNATSASASANGLTVPGLYTFNINVSDTSAAGPKFTSTDQVGINVFSSIPAPIVQAVQSRSPVGQNLNYPLILTQPQSSVSLLDQIYYDLKDGTNGIYDWSVVSSPSGANVSLSQPNTNNCLATGMTAAGNYVFQLIASDTSGNNVTQDVDVTVDPAPTSAPSIANPKGSAVAPGKGSLSATVTDTGNYNTSWWQVLSQPANSNVTFDNEASPNTNFYVTVPGTYTFQLDTVDQTQFAQTPTSGSGLITVTISSMPQINWNNAGGAGDGQTWDINGNQNWNNGSTATVYTDGSNVTFNDSNGGNYAVALTATVSPGSVTVNSSGNYTISGSGSIAGAGSLTKSGSSTLTLSTINTYTGGTIVNAGTLIVGVHGALPDGAVSISGATLQLGAGTGAAEITSLSITGMGTLDINNNHLIISYGSGPDPIASIAAWIASGFAGGSWRGPGITSSAAQGNAASYGIGYADSADPGNPADLPTDTIEILYTLLGDANLDGKVNGTDFTLMATSFNQSGKSWDQGDFNYDGDVNGSDFVLLAENFNQFASQSDISAADLNALDSFAAANGITLANVPEPLGVATIAIIAGTFLRRRRHQDQHPEHHHRRD